MDKKIRVVIADDSALMRKKISDILNADQDIEVVAAVKTGHEAIDAVHSFKPDVVTLDVEMPVMDGIEALGYIMSESPTPCVMISAFTKEGARETIKALEFGAVDFVAKPSGVVSPDIDKVGPAIIEKVKLAAKVGRNKLKLVWAEKPKEEEPVLKKPAAFRKLFVVASSTGGAQALATLLPKLKADLPAAVLIVQHMPEGFTKSLAERLNWQSKISVVEAEEKMAIKPGQVIIARGGKHMLVGGRPDAPYIVLNDDPPKNGLKPNADMTMTSAAKMFKNMVVGVVLTGMGSDGTVGSRMIKELGGTVIAQDQTSSIIYGMPKSVFDAGLTDKVVQLSDVAGEMERLIKN